MVKNYLLLTAMVVFLAACGGNSNWHPSSSGGSSTSSGSGSTGSTSSGSTSSTSSSSGGSSSGTGSTSGGSSSSSSSSSGSSSSGSIIHIMPLGDSITGSPGCWRSMLWNDLQDNDIDVDFVGSATPQGCESDYDMDHEGHGGILAVDLAKSGDLVGWLDSSNPDVVLMHLGTNDVWGGGKPIQEVLDAFTTLVNQMRANNYQMVIMVAQIIPNGCTGCAQPVIDFNAAIPAWAESLSTFKSPIVVVDQWTGFNTDTDTADGTHPNVKGDRKMATVWLDAMLDLILEPDGPSLLITHAERVIIGDEVSVNVQYTYHKESGYPSIEVLSPVGEALSSYGGSGGGSGGPVRMRAETESIYYTGEAGEHTVNVTWDSAPQLNKTSHFEVVERK